MSRLLIQNGLIVDTEWTRHADILIEDGTVVRISNEIDESTVSEGTEIIDAEGLCVLPGIIDAHTTTISRQDRYCRLLCRGARVSHTVG